MEFNSRKTGINTFTRKTNVRYYSYILLDSSIAHMSTIKDFGVQLDSKFYPHAHIDCTFSHP
jgi:hypothetical protein